MRCGGLWSDLRETMGFVFVQCGECEAKVASDRLLRLTPENLPDNIGRCEGCYQRSVRRAAAKWAEVFRGNGNHRRMEKRGGN